MVISNKQFEEALSLDDNKAVMAALKNRFSKSLSKDDIKSCCMVGLWMALQKHDPSFGRKFTTSLYTYITWECLQCIKSQQKMFNYVELDEDEQEHGSGLSLTDKMVLDECLACLDEPDRSLLMERFYYGKTLQEISKNHNISREWVRQKLQRVIIKARTLYGVPI